MQTITIALDAMGGDFGPKVTVPAALSVLKKNSHVKLILVGDEKILRNRLKFYRAQESDSLVIRHASEKVDMGESPAAALRHKKDSSMRVAINLVKEGTAQAVVSAGNTGALMATARFVLKMLEGVDRPAIVSAMPTAKRPTFMLDLGANVDSTPENLFQFALMGSELAIARGFVKPTVALLNIGGEQIKGNALVKATDALLVEAKEKDMINYVGYIEADSIFKGDVDVIVCDGFVGNVALKTSEGLSRIFKNEGKKLFYRAWWTKFIGLLAYFVLKPFFKHMAPEKNNGASLLGLKGVVIKSHGNATVVAFESAIDKAIVEVETGLTEKIHQAVTKIFQSKDPV